MIKGQSSLLNYSCACLHVSVCACGLCSAYKMKCNENVDPRMHLMLLRAYMCVCVYDLVNNFWYMGDDNPLKRAHAQLSWCMYTYMYTCMYALIAPVIKALETHISMYKLCDTFMYATDCMGHERCKKPVPHV